MKILLHTCCAPCSIYCIEELKKEKMQIDLFWYNPNIYPESEYQKRKQTLEQYSKTIGINMIVGVAAHGDPFLKLGNCENCYKTRLEQTAKYAKENGYDGFSTTLLISPYQKHELIKSIGNELGKFIYRDFRPGFRIGQAKAKELELYRQKYCGCSFSKENKNG